MPEVEQCLLISHFRRRDADQKIDFLKGTQVKVLSAGVCDGANMGKQFLSHCKLEGADLMVLKVIT